MSRWYRVSSYTVEIVPVEVVKESAEYVTLAPEREGWKERRARKSDKYFPTFAEARLALMKRYSDRADRADREKDTARQLLTEAFMLEETE